MPDRHRRGRPGEHLPGARAVAALALVLAAGCTAAPREASPPLPAPAPATSAPEARSEPASVRIPAIDVASPLLRLGIAPDGTAEVPRDYALAGWFAGRGRGGPTVLLGHVDSRDGPAVFYRLRDLRPGDVVEVGTTDGGVTRYAVERTEQVAKDAFPTFAVFGATADDVLRLVTCAGAFDRGARSYVDNLVVHARRV